MAKQICLFCEQFFEVEDDDLSFYERIGVPVPKFCPDDRQRRRAAFRNERNLYKRKCDGTGKEIISMFSPDKPFKVYDQSYWWSDEWDPLDYGRDFDFSKTFFEQFRELQLRVPRVSLFNWQSENSYYTNHSGRNKNCYMGFDLGGCEDVYHSNWMTHSKDCLDCSYTYGSELCYFTLYCEKCYNCNFCQECTACTDCSWCYDCKGCRNCFGCAGLRNKEYYVFNKPVTKEEYVKIAERYAYSYQAQKLAEEKSREVWLSVPHRYALIIQSDDCTGDYIYYSKNAKSCFDAVNLWDCKYCFNTLDIKNGYDCYQPGFEPSEVIYEVHGGNGLYNSKVLSICRNIRDSEYCEYCFESGHLFGCIGLRHKKYCIFNKQYEKEEYLKLKGIIIEHMKKTGEYGEFFSFSCSPFGYNESKAQEYYPLTREEALKRGFIWSDFVPEQPTGEVIESPEDIRDVLDTLLENVFLCEETKKPFKIIKQELAFYRRKNLPIPHISPQRRYEKRMAARWPRKLWNRACAKCNSSIITTYAPDRPETVYCEKCYLEAVY